jgi:hypothetical protein
MNRQYVRRPNGDLIEVVEFMPDRAPAKSRPRRDALFVKLPFALIEHLRGANGQTYGLPHCLLRLSFQRQTWSLSLANTTAAGAGIPPRTKWRALRDLERRGLVIVQARPNKSPLVHLLQM